MTTSNICDGLRWCVSQVFLVRSTLDRSYGDLANSCPASHSWDVVQMTTFEALFNHPLARFAVKFWWLVYDQLRDAGEIPKANPEATDGPWDD